MLSRGINDQIYDIFNKNCHKKNDWPVREWMARLPETVGQVSKTREVKNSKKNRIYGDQKTCKKSCFLLWKQHFCCYFDGNQIADNMYPECLLPHILLLHSVCISCIQPRTIASYFVVAMAIIDHWPFLPLKKLHNVQANLDAAKKRGTYTGISKNRKINLLAKIVYLICGWRYFNNSVVDEALYDNCRCYFVPTLIALGTLLTSFRYSMRLPAHCVQPVVTNYFSRWWLEKSSW